jgi:guanine deaminase
MTSRRGAFVVHGGTVVNPKGLKSLGIARKHSVCVNASGRIEVVAASTSARREHVIASGADVIDANGKFVTPGLVDTHCHGPQYRNAGTGTDLPLLQWLGESTRFRPRQSSAMSRLLATCTAKWCVAACATARRRAATLPRFTPRPPVPLLISSRRRSARVCRQGLHGPQLAPTYIEPSAARSLADTVRVVDYIEQLQCPTVHAVLTPRFVPTCSSELMHGLGALARERRVFVQSHISENVDEIKWVSSLHPDCPSTTPTSTTARLLNDRSVMAHAIYLSDEELALFRSTGASISHCPNSNFTICSGVLDVRRVLDAGVKVGLGTDVSGGYAPSMWDAIRMAIVASSVHSVSGNRPAPLGYAEAFYLATLGGARALALGDEIGSLEVWQAV